MLQRMDLQTTIMRGEQRKAARYKVIAKLRATLTKLTDYDLACYAEQRRVQFVNILQRKYSFTKEQADTFLGSIERQQIL